MKSRPLKIAFVIASLSLNAFADETALPDAKPVPRFQILPLPHDQASFVRDGIELTRYHFGANQERPFWYPFVHAPTGRSLTRMGHPHDPISHSHHNSVWISHNKVDGHSFWADSKRPETGTIVHRKTMAFVDGEDGASMRSVNHWRRNEDGVPILTETRTGTVTDLKGAELGAPDDWLFLVDIVLEPSKEDASVTFEIDPFGIIGVRMAKTVGVRDGGGRILNSEGAINEKAVFRKPARWVDYSGPIAKGATGGITLIDHPENPNYPAPFHVRNDGWMGACLTLDKAIVVTKEKPLRVRYALWVHDGVHIREETDKVAKIAMDAFERLRSK